LNETPEFPVWGLHICVDFDLKDSKKIENIKKLKKIIFHNTSIDIQKTANYPIYETRVLKLVFITIPCLKFWALCKKSVIGNVKYINPKNQILVGVSLKFNTQEVLKKYIFF